MITIGFIVSSMTRLLVASQYEDSNDDNDEQNNNEARQQYSYKSGWLQHMMLDTEDFKSDPSGGSITVRPIEGLDGVDYLAPGAMTNHVSYVFGPVIKALEKHGYNAKNGTPNNLIAATVRQLIIKNFLKKQSLLALLNMDLL